MTEIITRAVAEGRAKQPLTDAEADALRFVGIGPAGQPRLTIDHQSFDLDNAGAPWGRDRAEWYCTMLAVALARLRVTPKNEGRDTTRIAMDWLLNSRDTGQSSEAIVRHMLGFGGRAHYPLDPSDLGRCLRLLRLIPEWKPRMHEMAAHGAIWAALSARWAELEDSMEREVGIDWDKGVSVAPRTYALLQRIREEARP